MEHETPSECDVLRREICQSISDPPTRHRRQEHIERLEALITWYAQKCNPEEARFLHLHLQQSYGLRAVAEVVRNLQNLAAEQLNDSLESRVYNEIARLTVDLVPLDENLAYRQKAIEAAARAGETNGAFVIRVNRVHMLIDSGRLGDAASEVDGADQLYQSLPSEQQATAMVAEASGRLKTHRAKILLRTAASSTKKIVLRRKLVEDAEGHYKDAVGAARNDHRRCNGLIEWSHELIRSNEEISLPAIDRAQSVLLEAHRALDAHPCPHCLGFYYFVEARYYWRRGALRFPLSRQEALQDWTTARNAASTAVAEYQATTHPEAAKSQRLLSRIEERIAMEAQPRQVFLSHAGVDKQMVRDFKATLDILGYDPWLDEDAMAAGVGLHRALLDGFKNSCAAVFFMTTNFKDERYISKEVDYAIAEELARKDRFAIITLVFGSSDEPPPKFPELLRPFVWKTPKTRLEALREIIRGIPLKPASPVWKS